ncbi:putative lipoprotein [Citreicella sp. SE45]|nr:putative lipoprotein [Citreicella sp. SE45]
MVKDTTHFFRGVVHEDRFFGAEPPRFDPELAAELLTAQLASEAGEGHLTLRNPYGGNGASVGAMGAALAAGPAAARPAHGEAPAEVAEEAVATDAGADEVEVVQTAVTTEPVAVVEEHTAEVAEAPVVAAQDAPAAEGSFTLAEPVVAATPAPSAPLSDPESVAAKLRRIRAVVAEGASRPTPAVSTDAGGEDEFTEDEDTGAVSAMLGSLAPVVEELPEAISDSDDRLFADTLAGMDFGDTFDEDETLVAPEPVTPVAPEAAPPLRRARVVKVKRASFDTAVAAGVLEEVPGQSGADTVSSLSAEDEDDLARELAAVRAELEADFDAAWDDDDEVQPEPAARSEAAEAEWDEEEFSEAFEDEFYEDEDDDAVDAHGAAVIAAAVADAERLTDEGVRKAVKLASPGRVMLTENSVGDTDASRILDETNTQMREPEGNRRRSAIAHLRAAVAATRADKLLGRKKDAAEGMQPYREDLANVVRPRRPDAPASHTERPADQGRPAPLKLVAEQRVDSSAAAPVPRRVKLSDFEDDSLQDDDVDSGFATYAENVGATDLSELLEAAAAYMSFVERREQFSRPQLMTKVRQAELTESSREDRLRTFGQLLREGKIEKTRGGRFTASERISFKPDARAAG